MNKAVFTLLALIFCSLAGSCASFNIPMAGNTAKLGTNSNAVDVPVADNTVKSGIIVERADGSNGTIYVYIDGRWDGILSAGGMKEYELENGYHTVYVKGYMWDVDHNRVEESADPIGFTVNNDRHHFKVRWESTYITVEASVPTDSNLLNTAIKNSFDIILRNIPVNAKIAIVNIASNSKDDSNYILEELTLAFVNSRKFTVVDRQTLDVIRQEHNFQLSGEVSDETIVSIGNFTGASVVITGVVSGNGEMRRLRLRALDVKTAEVLAMSSEKI
jgi:hypothetical protein